MPNQQEIEKALRKILSVESDEVISQIAEIVMQVINKLQSNGATSNDEHIATVDAQNALQVLKGREIKVEQSVISFDQSQLGDVNIQDVVNGSKITIRGLC